MKQFNGAQLLIHRLQMHGIETVFGIPGGNILPIYDALYNSNITHILAKHEQGAAFMAQGMARSTGKPAVCMATSGPGATNLVTAIADAHYDSIPLICITGQVAQHLRGTASFQEVDMMALTQGITKRSFYVDDVNELASVIDHAFYVASSGRPGPVLIDIPKDVQLAIASFHPGAIACYDDIPSEIDNYQQRECMRLIHQAKRPVVIAGHGILLSGAVDELVYLTETRNIPIVTTLHGVGCMRSSHPLYFGMAGMHGSAAANELLNHADLVIALGIRFDDRLTGNINHFCPNSTFIHIDIDPSQLNRLKQVQLAIKGDLKRVLRSINPFLQPCISPLWWNSSPNIKVLEDDIELDEIDSPASWIRSFAASLPNDVIVTTDVGQHQMWVAQAFPFKKPGRFLTSGGQGTMGFGLPAAIGAAGANKECRVICFTGDGSLMMNLQELATLAELQLDVTIVVMNNGGLGMVRQQQELFFDNRLSASQAGYAINFRAVANAFGIPSMSFKLSDRGQLIDLQCVIGPLLIEVDTHSSHMVWPMMKPGKSIDSLMMPENMMLKY